MSQPANGAVAVVTSPPSASPILEECLAVLRGAFPGVELALVDPGVAAILVPAEHLVALCQYLKSSPQQAYDYLASLTAIDYLDRIDLVYQLRSLSSHRDVTLRIEIERDESVAPSVTGVWRAAKFQEREIFDLMGVRFTDHPNLKRILLYDEFDGHPL